MNQWINKTLEERFWVHVNKNGPILKLELGPCWEWTGSLVDARYGKTRVNGKCTLAHRAAWFLETGRWPLSLALHKCDNGKCVRFSHLFEGNQVDNIRDMDLKGRRDTGPSSKLTRENVNEIRNLYSTGNYTQAEIGRKFGVNQTNVGSITRGKTWKNA